MKTHSKMTISRSEYGYLWIHDAWMHMGSSSLVFEKILFWFSEIKPQKDFPEITKDVENWLERAKNGEDLILLVDEYMDGEQYKIIHECFKNVKE